jgi:hypothetical protein
MVERGAAPRDSGLQPIRFGEFLVERQALDDAQLLDALAEHWASGRRLGDTIFARGYLSREQIERYASEYEALAVVYI